MINTNLEEIKELELAKNSELAVKVSNITVSYRSYQKRPATFKETVLGAIKTGNLRYYSTFDALKNVSFEIKKGEVFGIIGSNGAGKSTLLRVLSKVLEPSLGTVEVNGKVDSLIQLGAGFDPDLNAIENIYLNASLHQLKASEIKERIPHILKFAELDEFASTPIRYYSSGMYARLGFSVAIDREPDILIVDEILGVGDERFHKKCNKVFERFINKGSTIIIVSHSLSMIENLCNKVALMSKGNLAFLGDPKKAIELYRDESYKTALA